MTLDTPMPAIERAYKARCEMLRAIFGGEEEPPPAKASRPMTPALFDALFASKH